MIFPATTAAFAALLALLYALLGAWVIQGRLTMDKLLGDGGSEPLQRRIRSHANFGEYVPLTLLLIGLLEADGAAHGFVTALLVILLVARVLHPFGMLAAKNTPQQYVCRGGGSVATLGVMGVAAIALLLRLAGHG